MKNWALAECGSDGAGHGDGANLVGQAVGRLVLDGGAGLFLFEARGIAAALDHEAVDDAVEDGVVVVTVTAVLQEVRHGLGAFSAFRVRVMSPWLVCRVTMICPFKCCASTKPARGCCMGYGLKWWRF